MYLYRDVLANKTCTVNEHKYSGGQIYNLITLSHIINVGSILMKRIQS